MPLARTIVSIMVCLAASAGCTQPERETLEPAQLGPHVPKMRPGEDETTGTVDPGTWVRRGRALEADKRPVEALVAYRNAMRMLPEDWPPQERTALENRIARLSFLMGVPGQVERRDLTKRPVHTVDSPAVQKARSQFALARELEQAGKKDEAMAAYRSVLDTIDDKDASDLYWHAWQRLEDLSPEGQGPAAEAEKEESESRATAGTSIRAGTHDRLPRASRRFSEAEADARLSQARRAYMAGMMAVDAGEREAARDAFETVLKLIDEDQDPELHRAAQANLRMLETPGRRPTPSPFQGY